MIVRFLKGKRRRQRSQVPDGVRIYAVGDIHGRADLLARVTSRVATHLAANPVTRPIVVFLGDYIDRGPSSKEVLDQLMKPPGAYETVFLRGNHEEFLLNFLAKPANLRDWGKVGGFETLLSYGVTPALNADAATQIDIAKSMMRAMPRAHHQFLTTLPTSFSCGGYFFVHAGVRPGVALAMQTAQDLLWIREEFLLYEEDFGKIIVHGHTPVPKIDIRPNRINLDTGAYITGRLSCVMLEHDRIEPLE